MCTVSMVVKYPKIMVSLTRYWIFSTVCCSLCASSLQLYTDYGQDYDTGDESKTDDQAVLPYYRNMLSQALKSSYYVPLDDTYSSARAVAAASPSATASEESETLQLDLAPSKRSRYYRKYPGKRQNRRYSDVYECNPNSRETVRLLFAIHQARQGDIDNIVFCNRLRNPKTLIPNPRYIGKRAE
ncbi:uncharacterized protein LOC135846809 isoform X3 [Planococcus citri]|uniref:uncharacterized protein LOC135846809 isoform X3 n=1 Tax=Planococcus citri TaxID=170843 RepID=UPI0031F8E034